MDGGRWDIADAMPERPPGSALEPRPSWPAPTPWLCVTKKEGPPSPPSPPCTREVGEMGSSRFTGMRGWP